MRIKIPACSCCLLDNKMHFFFWYAEDWGIGRSCRWRVSFSWLAGSRLQGRNGMGWFRLQPKVPWLTQLLSGWKLYEWKGCWKFHHVLSGVEVKLWDMTCVSQEVSRNSICCWPKIPCMKQPRFWGWCHVMSAEITPFHYRSLHFSSQAFCKIFNHFYFLLKSSFSSNRFCFAPGVGVSNGLYTSLLKVRWLAGDGAVHEVGTIPQRG